MSIKRNRINIWGYINDWFDISRLTFAPMFFFLGLLIASPMIYFSWVDTNYCGRNKGSYEYSFKQEIDSSRINKLSEYQMLYRITYEEEVTTYNDIIYYKSIISCSPYSILPLGELSLDTVVGDVLYKEANSDTFTIVHNEQEYLFRISSEVKKSFWERLSDTFK